MSTEAERILWAKRKDLVKRGRWRMDIYTWPSCKWPWMTFGWDSQRLSLAIGMGWLRRAIWFSRNYAWYTQEGEFVWGTLDLHG